MPYNYHPLPTISLPVTTDLVQADQRPHTPVSPHSQAVDVMTDLSITIPVSINNDASLKDAHERMVGHGIRLLFVKNSEHQLVGLVTATDLLGERPIQCMKEHGKHHADITVADVMTPRIQLEALNLKDVLGANVGQIVATMKSLGRQHALVVERNEQNGHYELSGLFSTSHIARLLGTQLSFIRIPQALSEIQHTLLHAG
ncbi:CBS domain-containing protein [Neisseriaceae bacterium TC5R-5]|nr:CBS domain-containing protein [Neisseriaceae bacterium TC5R-5]